MVAVAVTTMQEPGTQVIGLVSLNLGSKDLRGRSDCETTWKVLPEGPDDWGRTV